MKRAKVIATTLLATFLIAGFWGCSPDATSKKNEPQPNSPQAILEKAVKASKKIESSEVLLTMDMNMSYLGEEMNFSMEMNTQTFEKPTKGKIDMDIDMGVLGNQTSQIYVQENGENTFDVFTEQEDEWTYTEANLEAYKKLLKADTKSQLALYKTYHESFKHGKEENIDGVETFKLEGVLKGEALKKFVHETDYLDTFSGDITEEEFDSMISDTAKIDVSLWIDKKTYHPIKLYSDMTDFMNDIIKNTSEESGMSKDEVSVTKIDMTLFVKNINKVEDFTIPQEALDSKI